MAWHAYGNTRIAEDGSTVLLSSYNSAGQGVWLSDRDITDSSIPSLTANIGILIDLSNCMTYRAQLSYTQSISLNWPIVTGYNSHGDWVHSSTYPYIGIANARLILSKTKGGASGADITSVLNNSVYLTESYNGVINDEINHSTSASNAHDGYEILYASGSYGNFPDYRNDGTDNVSYCYGPTLVSAITSYSDINTYLDQGYCYAGIYFNMLRQRVSIYEAGSTSYSDYTSVDIQHPNNTYCTAEYSSSFDGSKICRAGSWRDIKGGYVYVNGAWKRITSMKTYVNGAWKEVPQTQNLEWAGK